MRDFVALRRALILAMVLSGTTLVSVGAVSAAEPATNDDEHCVTDVVGQAADGELIVGDLNCYDSFSEAILDLSDGEVMLPPDVTGEEAFEGLDGLSSIPFTWGIHYTGSNGTGSSISIKGNSCNGSYWNTGSTWGNKISSSYNGCYRLRHFDLPNRGGASADTTGAGVVRNLPSQMVNKTESVSYHP